MISMADEIDVLTEQQALLTERAIQAIRRNCGGRELPFKGRCYNCGENLSEGNYCDVDCVHDHRARLDAMRRKTGARPIAYDE